VSLAVLPFRDPSGKQDAYFTDGMTEAVATVLTRSPGLSVLDPRSTSSYRDVRRDPARIGRELGADYLLEGEIERDSAQLWVTVRLVEASTGRTVFSERLDRASGDLFAVRDEIAKLTQEGLASKEHRAFRTAPVRAEAPPTRNLEAYDLYLRANFILKNFDGRKKNEEAQGLLRHAVDLDPEFATAHARLGMTLSQYYFLYDSVEKWEQLAFLSIEKAMQLDPSLAEPHVARAKIVWSLPKGFQYEAALVDLLHAVRLDPNLVEAHQWLGILTHHLGLYDRSAEEFRRVLELDPTHPFTRGWLAWIENDLGRAEDTLAIYERNPKLDFGPKGEALLRLGRIVEARRLAEAELARFNDSAAFAWRAVVLARAGERVAAERDARRAAAELPKVGHIHHVEYDLARTHALLGHPREAMEWLERTARDGMPSHTLFSTDPFLQGLHGDAAFQDLMGRVKAQCDHYRALIADRSPAG
jgi:TolB-like protein